MEQLEYINKFVKIYGFKGLDDYTTKISSYDIDQSTEIIKKLNDEIDNLRKHFRYSDFALTKYKNKITNGTVALGVIKKVLQQANINFDIVKSSKHNYLRLSKPNILYNKFINSLNMDQVENSINPLISMEGFAEKYSKKTVDDIEEIIKNSTVDGLLNLEKLIRDDDIYDYKEDKNKFNYPDSPLHALVLGKGSYVKENVNINCNTANNFTPDIIEILKMEDNMIASSCHFVLINRTADLFCNVKSSHKYDICTSCFTITNQKYIPLISFQYTQCFIKFNGINLFEDNINCTYDHIFADTKERRHMAQSKIDLGNHVTDHGFVNYKKYKDGSRTNVNTIQERQYGIKTDKYEVEFNVKENLFIYDIELCVQDYNGNINYEYISSFGIKNAGHIIYEQKNINSRKSFKDLNINKENPIMPTHGKLFIKLNKLLHSNMYILMKCKSFNNNTLSEYLMMHRDFKDHMKPSFYILNNICYSPYGIVSGKTNDYIDKENIKHYSSFIREYSTPHIKNILTEIIRPDGNVSAIALAYNDKFLEGLNYMNVLFTKENEIVNGNDYDVVVYEKTLTKFINYNKKYRILLPLSKSSQIYYVQTDNGFLIKPSICELNNSVNNKEIIIVLYEKDAIDEPVDNDKETHINIINVDVTKHINITYYEYDIDKYKKSLCSYLLPNTNN